MTNPEPRPIFVLAEQLVQAWYRNEEVLQELDELRQRRKRLLAYLREPGCNFRLALAYVEQIEKAHRTQLERLRNCRSQTQELLRAVEELLPAENSGASPSQFGRAPSSTPARTPHQVPTRKYA